MAAAARIRRPWDLQATQNAEENDRGANSAASLSQGNTGTTNHQRKPSCSQLHAMKREYCHRKWSMRPSVVRPAARRDQASGDVAGSQNGTMTEQ